MTVQTTMPITALRTLVRLGDAHTARALRTGGGVLIGLAAEDTPVTWPDDAGHVLVAAGGGGGTTTVLRTLAAQSLARGQLVDILDLDQRGPSHPWATAVENVSYFRRIPAIHDHLIGLFDELRHAAAPRPQRLIVIEHAERLVFALRQFWSDTRPDSQLAEAPGVEALQMLLGAGPASGIRIAAGSPQGLGRHFGTAIADLFPTRLLAYAGQTLWARIAPEIWPVPPVSVIPGRLHAVRDRTATRLQALYLSESEAHAWARGATPKELR
ncbi:cell division protein FtsK [Streptomyces sp. NPDC001668]|uniref:cell division protein FtsK n=1 Tax=Streptomyces sp. NPDC001668 TaxID=3364598 RepID=UPI0036B588BC